MKRSKDLEEHGYFLKQSKLSYELREKIEFKKKKKKIMITPISEADWINFHFSFFLLTKIIILVSQPLFSVKSTTFPGAPSREFIPFPTAFFRALAWYLLLSFIAFFFFFFFFLESMEEDKVVSW